MHGGVAHVISVWLCVVCLHLMCASTSSQSIIQLKKKTPQANVVCDSVAAISAIHRWRPSWERDLLSQAPGQRCQYNPETKGWHTASHQSQPMLQLVDPEGQEKRNTPSSKRKALDIELDEFLEAGAEEGTSQKVPTSSVQEYTKADAEKDMTQQVPSPPVQKLSAPSAKYCFPKIMKFENTLNLPVQTLSTASAKRCFPKRITVGNSLNHEVSSDDEDLLQVKLESDASQRDEKHEVSSDDEDLLQVKLESDTSQRDEKEGKRFTTTASSKLWQTGC